VSELNESVCENPVMTVPIKKRINTELFIERTAAFYIGETRIREVTEMTGDQPVELDDWRIKDTMPRF